jgi:Universal stress protein family
VRFDRYGIARSARSIRVCARQRDTEGVDPFKHPRAGGTVSGVARAGVVQARRNRRASGFVRKQRDREFEGLIQGYDAMFKHVLIATDGSELATRALMTGLSLARSLGAKATVVTVTEPRTT